MKNYEVGLKIRGHREKAGINQAALAKKLGITKDQISNYETGKRTNMSVKRFCDICYALNITPEEFWKIS